MLRALLTKPISFFNDLMTYGKLLAKYVYIYILIIYTHLYTKIRSIFPKVLLFHFHKSGFMKKKKKYTSEYFACSNVLMKNKLY